jgi:hypothetical protein
MTKLILSDLIIILFFFIFSLILKDAKEEEHSELLDLLFVITSIIFLTSVVALPILLIFKVYE